MPTATCSPSSTPTNPVERFLIAAKAAGCPRDQVTNFLDARIALSPKQLAASAAARLCDYPKGPVEVGYGGARMGGKSHWMLAQLGDDCIRHPGLKCLLLRKVGGSGQENFEALLPKTIGRLGAYVPSRNVFRFHNGSWIKLGHFQNEKDVDKYLGLEYDVIGIEEDTTLSSSKRTAVRSCCRSPKGSGWRSRTYSTTNPGGVGHAAYRKRFIEPYRSGAETSTRFIPSTVDDNPVAPEEYIEFLDGLTGWQKRAWRFGDWDIAAGQFFTTWNRDAHVADEPITLPSNWRVWLALDYGFVHYTSCHLMAEDGDGDLYAIDEHTQRGWLVERHAAAIHAMLARHGVPPGRLGINVAGQDLFNKRHTGGTVAAEYAAAGLHFVAANDDRVNGAAEVLRRLGDVEAGIRPTVTISSRCGRLIECLPALEHDPNRPEDVKKVDCDDDGIGGDDGYDSFRYGAMAAVNRREWRLRRAAPEPTEDDDD